MDELSTEVTNFLLYFAKVIDEENVTEIHNLYEHGFPDLTERFFCPTERMWPDETVVENIVGSDNHLFIILYKELYYHKVYARNQRGPTPNQRSIIAMKAS